MNGPKRRVVSGRETEVDICPLEAGFVLSFGQVAIWLERRGAEDLVSTLSRALRLAAEARPIRPSPSPSRSTKRAPN